MLETLDINRYKIITYIYVCVIYTENLAAQSLYLHQSEPRFPAGELLLRQILEFSCVPSPTLLSPSAEEQDVSLHPAHLGCHWNYRRVLATTLSVVLPVLPQGRNKGSRMWSHNLRALMVF